MHSAKWYLFSNPRIYVCVHGGLHTALFFHCFGKASTDEKLPDSLGALARDFPMSIISSVYTERSFPDLHAISMHYHLSAGTLFAITFLQVFHMIHSFEVFNTSSQAKGLNFVIHKILGRTNPQK